MSKQVSYTATRYLISGRSSGDPVTIDLTNMLSNLEYGTVVRRNVNRSISGRTYLAFQNVFSVWRMTTIPLQNNDSGAKLMREFLRSVVDQKFSFAPGSEYDGGASPSTLYTVMLQNPQNNERRVRIGPDLDRFTFQFTLEQVV